MKPVFFETPAKLRHWFKANGQKFPELWIGLHKRDSGLSSVTYHEALDEALCVGWIDGVRKSLNDRSYVIRFTPRRPTSKWSAVNVKRASELAEQGLLQPAGRKAFDGAENKAASYSYEQRVSAKLSHPEEHVFRINAKAWNFFQSQPPWYRRAATWWVLSAKKGETRKRRLTLLIQDSALSRPVPPLTRKPKVPKR